MKKTYLKPQTEVVKIETGQFMCYSGVFGSRELYYDEYADDDY